MGYVSDTLAYCARYVIVWWYAERLSSSWSTRDSSIPLLTMTITSPLRLNSLLPCNDFSKALHVSNLSLRQDNNRSLSLAFQGHVGTLLFCRVDLKEVKMNKLNTRREQFCQHYTPLTVTFCSIPSFQIFSKCTFNIAIAGAIQLLNGIPIFSWCVVR